MNFSGPSAVVYLTPNSVVVAGKKITPIRLPLPVEMLSNMEIINTDKCLAACKRFFAERGLKGKKVIILLDPRVTFNKTIPLDQLGNPGELVKGFVAAMPFEPGQRACVSVNAGSQLRLYATNAQLYHTLEEALRQTGHVKITAITPAAAYDLSGIERSFAAAVAVYLKNTDVPKVANFLDHQPY